MVTRVVKLSIPTPQGQIELPFAQAMKLIELTQEYPGSYWHFNECGCCICLHPGGDKSRGWIIGSDGGADLHEADDESGAPP